MDAVKIRQEGIGSCIIESGNRKLFVDAFNDRFAADGPGEEDILVFTHADGDHFLLKSVEKVYRNNIVIGSPSVVMKLLEGGFPKDRLICAFPPENTKPAVFEREPFRITCFNTPHFLNWNVDHISVLIETAGKKIFITGDSDLQESLAKVYSDIDLLVLTLLNEDAVKGRISKEPVRFFHLAKIAEVQCYFHPKKILCNHLMNCDWSVGAEPMKRLVELNGIEDVYILTGHEEVMEI